jgi:hypothetical protein
MPVWAVWDGGVLWFSSSLRSRKIRNIAPDRTSRCPQRIPAARWCSRARRRS